MDDAELARMSSTLLAVVAEAERLVRTGRNKRKLRELVRRGREMHDRLLETLLSNPILATATVREVSETAGSAVDQLEALTSRPAP